MYVCNEWIMDTCFSLFLWIYFMFMVKPCCVYYMSHYVHDCQYAATTKTCHVCPVNQSNCTVWFTWHTSVSVSSSLRGEKGTPAMWQLHNRLTWFLCQTLPDCSKLNASSEFFHLSIFIILAHVGSSCSLIRSFLASYNSEQMLEEISQFLSRAKTPWWHALHIV